MSATPSMFVPLTGKFDPAKPKDWASDLALLDWDKTNIAFTKRTFLEFLKSIGISVGTNYTEINKLPKYATFGTLQPQEQQAQSAASATPPSALSTTDALPQKQQQQQQQPEQVQWEPLDGATHKSELAPVAAPANANAPRPSRRVREGPGGGSTVGNLLFGGPDENDNDDAASHAPPLSSAASPPRALAPTITTNQQQQAPPPASNHDSFSSSISNAAYGNPNAPRPSRRVREGPGGGSTVGDLLFGGPDENDEQVSFRTGKRLERNSKGAVGGEETWGPL